MSAKQIKKEADEKFTERERCLGKVVDELTVLSGDEDEDYFDLYQIVNYKLDRIIRAIKKG